MVTFGMFALAVCIGAWRQMNSLLQAKHPFDVARLWMNPLVKGISWLFVAALSLVSCYILAQSSESVLGEFIGQFLFGVALVARWLISMALGVMWLSKHYEAHEPS